MISARKIGYIRDEDGKKTSVVIPMDGYEAIIKDLDSIAERKKQGTISLDELKKNLCEEGRGVQMRWKEQKAQRVGSTPGNGSTNDRRWHG